MEEKHLLQALNTALKQKNMFLLSIKNQQTDTPFKDQRYNKPKPPESNTMKPTPGG